VRYLRALDPDGQAWGAPLAIDGVAMYGDLPGVSFAEVNGLPACASVIGQSGAAELHYTHALDPAGLPSVTVTNLPPSPSITMLESDGLPLVMRFTQLCRGQDAAGSAWDAPLLVAPTISVSSNLLEYAGRPACAYIALTGDSGYPELRWVTGF
jgi:hypothetical protein